MLKPKQLKTLANLQRSGLVETQEVIDWCNKKLQLSYRKKGAPLKGRRKYSKQYYKDILNFLQQDGGSPPPEQTGKPTREPQY